MRKSISRIRSVILCFATILVTSLILLSSNAVGRIILAAGDKTTISQEMLADYYQQHYTSDQKSLKIGMIFVCIAILIKTGLDIGKKIYYRKITGHKPKTTTNKILTHSIIILDILLLTAVVILTAWKMFSYPDPENATYSLDLETVIRTERLESTSREGKTDYTYYVYIKDDNSNNGERRMLINSNMYNNIGEPGEYYFAEVTEGKASHMYLVFPAADYEPAFGVPVT